MKKIWFLVGAVLIITLCLVPVNVMATNDKFTDQRNEGISAGCTQILYAEQNGGIGQQFVPSMPSLVGVAVYLHVMNQYGDSNNITVNIRENTIDGTMIATKTQLVPQGPDNWLDFDFASPVSVATGEMYVLELSSDTGTYGWAYTGNNYSAGLLISAAHGGPDELHDAEFRTYGAVIDQRNEGTSAGCEQIKFAQPIGQQFVPSMPSLVGVAVYLSVINPGHGDSNITVNIRENTIDGTIVASKSRVLPEGPNSWLYFEFTSSVVVTPGAMYILELTSDTATLGWNYTEAQYSAGSGITQGLVSAVHDYSFRTYASFSITAPEGITIEANTTGGAMNVVLGDPTVWGGTSPYSITNDAPSFFPLGDTVVMWTATDAGGNLASDNQTVTVVDTTPPTITVVSSLTVIVGAPSLVLPLPTASDIVDPSPTVANDAPSFFLLGTTTVTWTATDAGGNSAAATTNVTAVYNFGGFLPRLVKNGAGDGLFKAGSTIPVKFQITDYYGNPVSTATGIASINTTPAASAAIRYDTTAMQYIANLKTPKGAAPGPYTITVTLKDNTSYTILVTLK